MSLLHLFSRPKVELLRGYVEPGLPPASRQEVGTQRSRRTSMIKRGLSTKNANLQAVRPTSQLHDEGTSSEWQAPQFSDVYGQALRIVLASTATVETESINRAYPTRRIGATVGIAGTAPTSQRITMTVSPLSRKIFALLPSGFLLQYTDKGTYERLPEKVIVLSQESVAVSSDTIPGRPYTLLILSQAPSDADTTVASNNLLTKLGFRYPGRASKADPGMRIILDDPETLTDWLLSLRNTIASMPSRREMTKRMSVYRKSLSNSLAQSRRPSQALKNLPAAADRGQQELPPSPPLLPKYTARAPVSPLASSSPTSYLFPPSRPVSTTSVFLPMQFQEPPSAKSLRSLHSRPDSRGPASIASASSFTPGTSPDSFSDSVLSADSGTPATSVSSMSVNSLIHDRKLFTSPLRPHSGGSEATLVPSQQISHSASVTQPKSAVPARRLTQPAVPPKGQYRQLSSVKNARPYMNTTVFESRTRADSDTRPASAKRPSLTKQSTPADVAAGVVTPTPNSAQVATPDPHGSRSKPGRSSTSFHMPLRVVPQAAYKPTKFVSRLDMALKPSSATESSTSKSDKAIMRFAATAQRGEVKTDANEKADQASGKLSLFPSAPATGLYPPRQDSIINSPFKNVSPLPSRRPSPSESSMTSTANSSRPQSPPEQAPKAARVTSIVREQFSPELRGQVSPESATASPGSHQRQVGSVKSPRSTQSVYVRSPVPPEEESSALPPLASKKTDKTPSDRGKRSMLKRPASLQIRTSSASSVSTPPVPAIPPLAVKGSTALSSKPGDVVRDTSRKKSLTSLNRHSDSPAAAQVDVAEPVEAVKSIETTKPVKSAEKVEAIKPVEPAEAVEVIMPVIFVERVKPVRPARPDENAAPTSPRPRSVRRRSSLTMPTIKTGSTIADLAPPAPPPRKMLPEVPNVI